MNTPPINLLNLGDNIKVIVLTGGPCSGKTTALALLSRALSDRGWKVIVIPESTTALIGAGMLPGELSPSNFQRHILLHILAQEERFFLIAQDYVRKGQKVVVIADRGTLDGEAYLPPGEFETLIGSLGHTYRGLSDDRYHAVVHLRSAAIGAPRFYTLANNSARTETIERARELDQLTLDAWTRHGHPRVVDNSTGFDHKMRKVLTEILAILGDPVPLEIEDKFTIVPFGPETLPVRWYESTIKQDYLVSPSRGEEHRVRARTGAGGTTYYYTIKQKVTKSVRFEKDRLISEGEYNRLLELRDRRLHTIHKRRICFFWSNQFFEVDFFLGLKKPLATLEAEKNARSARYNIPPFIRVIERVTDDRRFSNRSIARWKMAS